VLIYLALLWNAEHLPGIDKTQIGDAVHLGDGPHTDPVAQRNAVKVLAPDDGVVPAARGGRRGAAVELARADPAGRQRLVDGGNRQDLADVDDIGVENPVLRGDGVGVSPDCTVW